MSTPPLTEPTASPLSPDSPASPAVPGRPGVPVSHAGRVMSLVAGLAVALSSSALSGVLRGDRWLWYVLATVGLVVALGQLARAMRLPAPVVPLVQLVGLLLLLTGLFTEETVLRVIPGPAALTELAGALGGAVTQIEGGVPPVPTTAALALLVSVGFGVVSIGVDAFAAAGHAPAACGLVLLGAYTVPTALAPSALPDWSLAAGAFGYMLVLLAEHRRRQTRRGIPAAPPAHPRPGVPGPVRRLLDRAQPSTPSGSGTALSVLLTAVALGAALGVGVLASPIGTHGRFPGTGHDSGAGDGQFGLNPFTSLRGQLDSDPPVELLRVRGLPSARYLRALTLTRYVPHQGWQLPDRYNGVTMGPSLPSGMAVPVNNPTATVSVRNVGYLDQWLPLYGLPMGVTGVVSGRWHYDVLTNTAYAELPVHEASWTERAGLPNPPVSALEQSPPATDVSPTFLDTAGVDPRISALAQAVTRQAHSPYLRAVALNRYFLDPGFGFRYSIRTHPGNSGDDLVDFLTRGKAGYCEQFASAMAVMLRTVGVPARVAIGFSPGKLVGDYRSITTGDAHAWVEAYFAGIGWLPFDPTPLDDGRSAQPDYVSDAPRLGIHVPPSVQAGQPDSGQPQAGGEQPQPDLNDQQHGEHPPSTAPPDQGGPDANPGGSASPGHDEAGGRSSGNDDSARSGSSTGAGDRGPGDTGSGAGPSGAGPGGGGGSGAAGTGSTGTGLGGPGGSGASDGWRIGDVLIGARAALLTALAVLMLVGLAFIPAAARQIARRRRLSRAARGGPDGALSAWREVLADFRDRGSEPAANDTVRSAARRMTQTYRLEAETIDGMKHLVMSVERGLYAPLRDPGPGSDLVSAVATVHSGLARSAPLPLAARLWPRSALPTRGWWRKSKTSARLAEPTDTAIWRAH